MANSQAQPAPGASRPGASPVGVAKLKLKPKAKVKGNLGRAQGAGGQGVKTCAPQL
jgi:hypothetical protein